MFGEEFASVYPKVKSWLRSVLRADRVDEILRLPYDDYVSYLKNQLRKVSFVSEDPVMMEGQLKQEAFFFVGSGKRFLAGSVKDFMDLWQKTYEIENLKLLTRAVLNQRPVDFLYRAGENSRIQIEFVKNIRTLDDLVEFLSGTEYYRLALDGFERVREERTTFYFEMNLDNYYAQSLKKKMATLAFQDRKSVRDLLFYHLEMLRLLWIYRAKFNYGIGPEQILAILPNVFHFIPKNRYQRILNAGTPGEFIDAARYAGLIPRQADVSPDNLERAVYAAIHRRARKAVGGSPFSLGVFLGFLLLQMINVRNHIVILEGKRLKVPSGRIRDLLVVSGG